MSKSPTGAPRRVAVGLLAGALSVFGIALAPNAGAIDSAIFDRVAGTTRYGTAGAVATEGYPDGSDCVIIATGEVFADSLAASGLAGSLDCPVLLVQQDSITEETAATIEELGATTATIVGGTSAVSEGVETSLAEDLGLTVNRIAGDDRYATAAAIADAIDDSAVSGVVIVASGEVAADAQSAGPIAAALDAPILLVTTDDVPAVTSDALAGRGEVLVVGGTARISDATEADIEAASDDADAQRLAGLDRQETAAIIAEQYEVATLAWDPDTVLLAAPNAPSDDFSPDALVAGPLGGLRMAPTLIIDNTDTLGEDAEAFIDAHSDSISEVLCIGGTAVISDEVCAAAEAAARNTSNDTPTGGDTQTSALAGPELQSCAISGLDLDDLAIVYTFTFDDDVDDTVQSDLFVLYGADSRHSAGGNIYNGGDDVDVDGENVAVTFNLADYGVASATLCAVAEGAVEDADGNVNPAQSVAAAAVVNASGSGLLSVEITDAEEGIVEYTFSSPQIPGLTKGSQYELIDREGVTYTSNDVSVTGQDNPSVTSPDEDEPSTVVEVDFSTDFSDITVRRGVVKSNTSPLIGGSNTSVDSRINAADVTGGGTTDAPDLVGLELASDNEDLEDDEALFIFDEAIDSVGAAEILGVANLFDLVYSNCDPSAAGSIEDLRAALAALPGDDGVTQDGEGFDDDVQIPASCIIPGVTAVLDADNNRAVLVTFGSDDIDNEFLVAAQVAEGAGVSEVNGAGTLTNDDDEFEVSADAEVFADGEVFGPQLIGATVEIDTNVFGDFQDFIVTLTFDKDLDDALAITGLGFWYNDGDSVEREDLDAADCDYQGDTTIVCEINDEDSALADVVVISADAGAVRGADTYALDSDELAVQFTSPEASVPVVSPGAPA